MNKNQKNKVTTLNQYFENIMQSPNSRSIDEQSQLNTAISFNSMLQKMKIDNIYSQQSPSNQSVQSIDLKRLKTLSQHSNERLILKSQQIKYDEQFSDERSSNRKFSQFQKINQQNNFFLLTDPAFQEDNNYTYQKNFKTKFQELVNDITKEKMQEKRLIQSPISPHPIDRVEFIKKAKFYKKNKKENPQMRFDKTYKEFTKIKQTNEQFNIKNDLETTVLQKEQKFNLLPKKLNLIGAKKDQQTDKIINLNNYYYGKRYIPTLTAALKHKQYQSLQNIQCHNNSFNDLLIKKFIKNLPSNIRECNLSCNNINTQSAIHLNLLFSSQKYKFLNLLNIENNQIGDKGLQIISNQLMQNSCIKILNISKNRITDQSGSIISQILTENSYLDQLYLKWNQIQSDTGLLIAQALLQNQSLKVLDLSHNALGLEPLQKTGLNIIKACNNKLSSIIHLDISFNSYKKEEFDLIENELKYNHTIYGLHFEGNCNTSLDPQGYLHQVSSQYSEILNDLAYGTINKCINGTNYIGNNQNLEYDQFMLANHCWICDGWQEIKFYIDYEQIFGKLTGKNKFTNELLKQQQSQNILYVHLCFEKFQPDLLELDQNDNLKYTKNRMVPSSKDVYYFFSRQTANETTQFINIEQESIDSKDLPQGLKESLPQTLVLPKRVNILRKLPLPEQNNLIIFDEYYEPQIQSIPRPIIIVPKIKVKEQPKLVIFRKVFRESDIFINQCFEFDWNCSKLPKLIKDEQDLIKLKELLRKNYKQIKNAYKYYASVGNIGEIFCITVNPFSEFIQGCGQVVDGKLLKISDVDLNFIMTNSGKEKNLRNPDRALIRYSFMEILVRLAADKYIKTKQLTSYTEAFSAILKDGLEKKLNEYENPIVWKENRLWNLSCDQLILKNQDFLKQLYDRFSGTQKQNQKTFTATKFLSLNEFKDFLDKCSLLDDNLVERDAEIIFNYSMQQQVDEVYKDRHFQMTFHEFIEAFSRCAEKKYINQVADKAQSQFNFNYTQQFNFTMDLEQKIEMLINYLKNEPPKQEEESTTRSRKATQTSIKPQISLRSAVKTSIFSLRISKRQDIPFLQFKNDMSKQQVNKQQSISISSQSDIEEEQDDEVSQLHQPLNEQLSNRSYKINKNYNNLKLLQNTQHALLNLETLKMNRSLTSHFFQKKNKNLNQINQNQQIIIL